MIFQQRWWFGPTVAGGDVFNSTNESVRYTGRGEAQAADAGAGSCSAHRDYNSQVDR